MKESNEFLIKSRITFAKRANMAARFFQVGQILHHSVWHPSSAVSFYLGTFAAENFERLCLDDGVCVLTEEISKEEGATLILLWKEINLQQTKKESHENS